MYEPLRDYLALVDGRMRELEGDNWALRARLRRCEDALGEVRGLAGALRGALGEFAPPRVEVGQGGEGDKARRSASRSPTRRARSRPASPPSLPSAIAAPGSTSASPSLPATLAALTSTTASHAAQLASLGHAHAQHAQHAADELAGVRAQLAGVRQQVAQWAMLVHEREREREREREEWARASWARGAGRSGMGPRTASDELPLSLSAAAGELGDSGGSSGSDDEYGPSAAGRPFGPPPMGSSYPGAGAYPSAFRRGPHMGVPLPPGLRVVPQPELLLGAGGMSAPGWDGVGGGPAAYGYGMYGAHEMGALLGGAGGVALGPGGGAGVGGAGRARGIPIPMGGAGAVKL